MDEARERARKARQLLTDGIDPLDARNEERTIQAAERALAEALSREPDNGQYVYNHGVALSRLGRKDEAAAQMNRAAALGYRPPR